MSYTRTFSQTIAVPYSGRVSLANGQSASYSGTVHETVHVSVHVDTDPFDESVDRTSRHVNALTASVTATEAAQIKTIRDTSARIGKTIVQGFFKTVRSELGQKIAQLQSHADATLLHLTQLSKRVREKQAQMETDYTRITERYSKIFADLNRELEIRVHELDKPAFDFAENASSTAHRTLIADGSGIAAVTAAENARAQTSIVASATKHRALATLRTAKNFLTLQQLSRDIVERALRPDTHTGPVFVPICYAQTVNPDNKTVSEPLIFKPSQIPNSSRRTIASALEKAPWQPMKPQDAEKIRTAFHSLTATEIPGNSDTERRVKQYLSQFILKPTLSI